jgi:transcriptional regulator GlxA family with amidase domain
MTELLKVGILLFNDVEVLDFAGPFEVFSLAEKPRGQKVFEVRTVSQQGAVITACGGLRVLPDCSFETAPRFDILIVPGGVGARATEVHNPAVIEWIKAQAQSVQLLASVCTGAFLLAEAGLLNGLAATTHWAHTEDLAAAYPAIEVRPGVKFVDQGKIITSGGISSGINMSLYFLRKLLGRDAALAIAKAMEYEVVL